jgi:WD40 repeat protein
MIKASTLQNIRQGKFKDTELLPEHGRNVVCAHMDPSVIITGSADHGLRVWKTQSLDYSRELFSKQYGHKEWVTSVQTLTDGRIVSAGMDGMICVWDRSAVRCDTLLGHETSISKVVADSSDLLLSSSYDCTIRVWPLSKKTSSSKKTQCDILVGPHKAPVLDFVFKNSLVASGDKNGVVAFWDLNNGTAIFEARCHGQGVGIISFFDNQDDRLICTGGLKDGIVNLWDLRSHKSAFSQKPHSGSVNVLAQFSDWHIVSGSADKGINIVDIRHYDKPVNPVKVNAGVMCGKTAGDLLLAGLADGNFLVYDLKAMKPLYGFGAMKVGCVKAVEMLADGSKVLVAGDDPVSLVFDYS